MSQQAARRFLLSDAVMLIFATAIGAVLVRTAHGPGIPELIARLFEPSFTLQKIMQRWSPWIIPERANVVAMLLAFFLLVWTITLAVQRLRGPRPPLNEMVRRPGSAAILLSTSAIAWRLVEGAVREGCLHAAGLRESVWKSFSREPSGYVPWYLFIEGSVHAVAIVLLTYMTAVLLTRAHDSRRDWLDWAGLGLGLVWLTVCIINRISSTGMAIVGDIR